MLWILPNQPNQGWLICRPHTALLKGLGFAFGMHWITARACDAPAWGKRTSLTFPYKDIPSLHSAVLTACSIYSSLPKESIGRSFLWQMKSPFHFDFASETTFFCLHRKTNEQIAQSLTLPCFPISNLVVKRCMMSYRGKNLWDFQLKYWQHITGWSRIRES